MLLKRPVWRSVPAQVEACCRWEEYRQIFVSIGRYFFLSADIEYICRYRAYRQIADKYRYRHRLISVLVNIGIGRYYRQIFISFALYFCRRGATARTRRQLQRQSTPERRKECSSDYLIAGGCPDNLEFLISKRESKKEKKTNGHRLNLEERWREGVIFTTSDVILAQCL